MMLGLAAAGVAPAQSQTATSSNDPKVLQLLQQVARNEAEAEKNRAHYFYFSEERSDRTGQHLWLEAIAETEHGPLRRLLQEDGHRLGAARQQAVDQHLAALAADPSALDNEDRSREQDRKHGEALLASSPELYSYQEAGSRDGVITIAFRPNSSFVPDTYEQRVLHAMVGTVTVDEAALRMLGVDARLSEVVKFGYGFLGSVQSGTIHLVRTKTAAGDFKPSTLDFDINGHILFFHTLGRQQHLQRRGFVLLPANQSLADAAKTVMAAKE